MLGYEVEEDQREFESERVTRYSTSKMQFPCFIVMVTEEHPLKQYALDVLKKMFVKSDVYDEELSNSLIHLYFSQAGKTVQFGVVQSSQVKTFLRLFEFNEVQGYLDKDTPLSGDKLYVLST